MLSKGTKAGIDGFYLENTKTVGTVVRTVLDEYEMFEASSDPPSSVFRQSNHASMMYDASLLLEFKTWVEMTPSRMPCG